jgi:uncharacterized protein DUF4400
MIRIVAVTSLMALLVLVLYVPSANPPQRFVNQIRIEHEATADFWGAAPAMRILTRAIGMQDSAAEVTPIPKATDAPPTAGLNNAVAQEMSAVNQRLFNNPYFRSVDAALLLASYRLATLIEWLPWLGAFGWAVLVDGWYVRLIKAKEFRQHDPEMFALFAGLAIVAACATIVAFVVPLTLPPLLLPCAPLAISVLVSRALACFHRRA